MYAQNKHEYFTIPELSAYLKMGMTETYRFAKKMPNSTKDGKNILIPKSDIESYILSQMM